MDKGDHIFVYRRGYSHHGIDCGEGTVIHYESNAWMKLAGRTTVGQNPRIRCVPLAEFSQGCRLNVRVL